MQGTRNLCALTAAMITAIGMTTVPAGATGQELLKLVPADGAQGDQFGRSVGLAGTVTIVGAWLDNDNGLQSGSAYLYETSTGQLLHKLLPTDGTAYDWFGFSVAISGTTAIVGAPNDDDHGLNSGAAYLFNTSTGQQTFKLTPADGAAQDQFGWSVAISGTTAIVGAMQDDDHGTDSGSAYLFNTATGQQIFKLAPADGAAFDWFGRSVAISGTTALIGARYDDDNGVDSGSAYLFSTATGLQIGKLHALDGAAGDSFGDCVALDGNTAVIGAYWNDDNGSDSGSAYVFDTTSGAQIAKLLPTDGEMFDWFGSAVAVSGTTAIVGAPTDDDLGIDSGSAYVFDTVTGTQISKLLASDGVQGDDFGGAVAVSGAIAVIGAKRDGDHGPASGAAYVFDTGPKCTPDLDGSGVVDVLDLLAMLAVWGPCPGCVEDLNGDDVVDVLDLLDLLAAWGPCP